MHTSNNGELLPPFVGENKSGDGMGSSFMVSAEIGQKTHDSRMCLDVDKGQQSVGGNEKIYRKIIKLFYAEYEGVDAIIVQHISNNENEIAIRLSHSIKSAAGQIGAKPLSTVATQLERTLQKQNMEIDPLLVAFTQSLNMVLAAISAHLNITKNICD